MTSQLRRILVPLGILALLYLFLVSIGMVGASFKLLGKDAAVLARSAQTHYQVAQQCLQRGDWACYGAELEALGRDLEALIIATEE